MTHAQPQLPALPLSELEARMQAMGEPRFRARQLWHWLRKGVTDPQQMRNLPQDLRQRVGRQLLVHPLTLSQRWVAEDGTRKYLFSLAAAREHKAAVEAVFIPEEKRGTVCVSTQAGCVFSCPFCHTGTQPFTGNLSAGEIVAQILAIKHDLGNTESDSLRPRAVTHIVYMGMGEPLANERGVHESLRILLDPDTLGFSRRRITVSTSGLLPQIRRLGAAWPVNLAVSLHAAQDALRNVLVPANRKYPLADLRRCLDTYPLGPQRHITFEYVMLRGVNDRDCDLEALRRFVRPGRERVNLIPYNPWPGSPYRGTAPEEMHRFAGRLIAEGIRTTVRRSRGLEIMAACGQLRATAAEADSQPT